MTTSRRRTEGLPPAWPVLLALAAVLLLASGCVSAGLAAAGPLFSAVQAVADRSVERTVPAELGTAWVATVTALERMGIRPGEREQTGEAWRLQGASEHVTVHARLEPVAPRLTRVSIRAEAGRLLADKKTGEEILNQVAAAVAPAPPAVASAPAGWAGALGGLQREVRDLRSRLDAPRAAAPAAAPPDARPPAPRGRADGVVVVPVSLGVPILAAPPDSGAARTPAPRASAPPPVLSRPAAAPEPAAEAAPLAHEVLPSLLEPVGTLRPVAELGLTRR